MFQNLIFVMSLSGSIVCLLYIVTYPLAKRYFPLKWRYFMLKTAVIFFHCFSTGEPAFLYPAATEKLYGPCGKGIYPLFVGVVWNE